MKILLITPNNPYNIFRVPQMFKIAGKLSPWMHVDARAAFPGLNLAIVAAITPPDIPVRIIDESVEPIDFDNDADLIGITGMTNMAPVGYRIADEFRRRGKKVVLGGVHVTVCADEAQQHADAVLVGEAEPVWHEVVRDFQRGQLKPRYRPQQLHDMTGYRVPRRDLLKQKAYLFPSTIETGRGCPFDCEFCSVSRTAGRGYRFRPTEHVLEDVASLKNRFVFFVDDIINGHRQHALELFRALRDKGLKWAGQATVMIARDDELLDAAVEAGCRGLFIGFETFSSPNLKKLGKPDNWRQRFFQACEALHRKKVAIWGGFVFGLDTDTIGSLRETVKLAADAELEFAQFSKLTPLPGTAQWKQFTAEDRIMEQDWSKFNFQSTVYRPKQMSAEELDRVVRDAWREFYSAGNIARRLLRNRPPVKKGNLMLWALNLGISRIISQYKSYEGGVRAHNQPETVFERMQQQNAA
ncbi:MAG: radical SAM protein [Terriglobales bacterium]